jgi:prepilin-type N-terminal cleavage/methylation domain-containing protein
MKQPKSSIRGFTLIEVMLVIVVLSIISVYAIKMIRTSTSTALIQKAAAQAINIQQAAMAYYVASQSPNSNLTAGWPSNLSVLVNNHFLPNNNVLCSPFVTSASGTAPCYNYAEFSNDNSLLANSAYYTLQLTVPNSDIAYALAAKLPSAWVNGNNNTVVNSAIPIPGTASNAAAFPGNGWIMSAGIVSTRYSTNFPNSPGGGHAQSPGQVYMPICKPGYEGHIITAPLLASTSNTSKNTWQNMYVTVSSLGNPSSTNPASPPYANLAFLNSEHTIHMMVYYMTFCIKTGYWGSSNYDTFIVTTPTSGYNPYDNKNNPQNNEYNPWEDSQTASGGDWNNYFRANGTKPACDSSQSASGSTCVQEPQPMPAATNLYPLNI